MKQLSRVVWNEGMHLAQHHFQAQSRYFEDAIQFALSSLFFAPYGLAGCELDIEAIRNDTVSLVHARGVLPDGLPFDIPASDAAPDPIDVRELFSPTSESHLVLLTIPPYQPDRPNFASNGESNGARYRAESAPVLDDTTGRDERPVSLGRKNFRLALDVEATDGLVSLPIARVRRDGSGHFMYDPEYIPPCVQVGASDRLMYILQRLIEILDNQDGTLSIFTTMLDHAGPAKFGGDLADPSQLAGLSTTDVGEFTTTQIGQLFATQVGALSTTVVGALTSTEVGALTASQIPGFTTTQLQQLSTTNISLMNATQLAAFTTTQVQSFNTAQVAAYL